jgi:hypothetical protein
LVLKTNLYQGGKTMANHHGRAEKELVQEEILLDDPDLNQWREQPLEAEGYPYLFVDARYEKVRVNDRVVSEGVLIVADEFAGEMFIKYRLTRPLIWPVGL